MPLVHYRNEMFQHRNTHDFLSLGKNELCSRCVGVNFKCDDLPGKYNCNEVKQRLRSRHLDVCKDTMTFPQPIATAIMNTINTDCSRFCSSCISEHAEVSNHPSSRKSLGAADKYLDS